MKRLLIAALSGVVLAAAAIASFGVSQLVVSVIALLAGPPGTGAASSVCVSAVCADATRAFHPILGLLMSGGNPVLGSGSALIPTARELSGHLHGVPLALNAGLGKQISEMHSSG